MDSLLETIQCPEDLKKLSMKELDILCSEIRQKIIETVSQNGGHLASNLGVVELTVALHRVFDTPQDKIVWDVGHQSYPHKILTGRCRQIHTIRTKDGLAGFPKLQESPYDAFGTGHSSTSISAALGIAYAQAIQNISGHVIAVIGDGALSGGLAYEGLNNAGRFHRNFIVILNDNKMSISKNVGSMARYLTHIRTKAGYLKIKGNVETTIDKIPFIGRPLHQSISKSKNFIKQLFYPRTIFEDMGFVYYGPFDGHDLRKLITVFENTKNIDRPILLHVVTSKGKGYSFAEKNPGAFHGMSSFDIKTGKSAPSEKSFSDLFGTYLCEFAKEDKRICAITAAMQTGTGLTDFKKEFPERFFDVGIAEEHAITFAAGLATSGMIPVCAIYSTFLQRGFDQILHDAALQKLKVVLAIDRAGIVGEDGETHQGIFDVPFLNSVPNITIYAPAFYEELYSFLRLTLYQTESVVAIRYPRGNQLYKPADFTCTCKAYLLYGKNACEILVVTYGRAFSFTCLAKEKLLEKGIRVNILKLNRIKPIDSNAIQTALSYKLIFFFEESVQQGGIGEHFYALLGQNGFEGQYVLHGIDDQFVKQGTMQEVLSGLKLTTDGMIEIIMERYSKSDREKKA